MIRLSQNLKLIFIIFFSISILSFYKSFLIYKKTKNKIPGKCLCTNKSLNTTYQRNIYTYYFTYIVNKEEYYIKNTIKYHNILFNPKINSEIKIYITPDNPKDIVDPLELFYCKTFFTISIICLIIPFLLSI